MIDPSQQKQRGEADDITLADQNRDMLNAFGKLFAARGYPNQTAFDGTQVLRRPSASADV